MFNVADLMSTQIFRQFISKIQKEFAACTDVPATVKRKIGDVLAAFSSAEFAHAATSPEKATFPLDDSHLILEGVLPIKPCYACIAENRHNALQGSAFEHDGFLSGRSGRNEPSN